MSGPLVGSPSSVYPACLVSHTVRSPQIILLGSAFSTSLITYMAVSPKAHAAPSSPSYRNGPLPRLLSVALRFDMIR